MGGLVSAIFKGPPDPPDNSAMLEAQRRQEEKLAAQEKKAQDAEDSRKRVIAARSGRGQGVTLFPETGEGGVKGTLG